jgi:hypothetical protein
MALIPLNCLFFTSSQFLLDIFECAFSFFFQTSISKKVKLTFILILLTSVSQKYLPLELIHMVKPVLKHTIQSDDIPKGETIENFHYDEKILKSDILGENLEYWL